MEDIKIIYLPLPYSIKAYTVCSDGFYTIVLNCNLSWEQNKESYQHEMHHIQNGDFEKRCSADLIEIYSH